MWIQNWIQWIHLDRSVPSVPSPNSGPATFQRPIRPPKYQNAPGITRQQWHPKTRKKKKWSTLINQYFFWLCQEKKNVFSFLRKTMHRFIFEVAIHKQSLIMKLAPAQEHVSHNPGPQIDVYPVHPFKNRCQTESTQGCWAVASVAQGISIWGQSDRVCRLRLAHPFPSHQYEWHAQSKDVWRCRKGKGDLHEDACPSSHLRSRNV